MVQYKHGRHVPAFVLLFLAEEPAYGLTLLNKIMVHMPNSPIDSAAVYRTLKDLEKINAVTSYWDTAEPGPAKKWYKLTDIGFEKLREYREDIEMRKKNLEFFLTHYKELIKESDHE